jgi:tetratricopeptide (TPR) repeat protein
MIKLKKIVTGLSEDVYKSIEDTLVKNKSDNFLFLLQSYRKADLKDSEISATLTISSNSLYVLKSRLNDKIQEHLSGDIYSNKEDVFKQLHQIPEICFGSSREVALTFLQKLEKDLLLFDMHNELLVVYSALKKINLYSDKYFHYSQLYNKHTAFNISLEKCEEILGNFNRALSQYNFSRSEKIMETLLFLNKEIIGHYTLNPSRQIEVIKNIVELQLLIFFNKSAGEEIDIVETLAKTEKILKDLPESSVHKNWIHGLNYLSFEYYRNSGQLKQAASFYDKTNEMFEAILLYTNVCLTSRFLTSKICYLQDTQRIEELAEENTKNILIDSNDTHAVVIFGIYNAMLAYYRKNYKEAASKLNEIINVNSFKDYFHINTSIKLTLAFMYMHLKEYDLADSLLKNIHRKIKSEGMTNYNNVLDLIKIFNADIKQNGKIKAKQKDEFILFQAKNVNESRLLMYLEHELKKRYS